MQSQGSRGGWLFWPMFGLSLTVHLGTGGYFLARAPQGFGAADHPTAAISVSLEASDILEVEEEGHATSAAAGPTGLTSQHLDHVEERVKQEEAERVAEEAEKQRLAEEAEKQRLAAEEAERQAEIERQRIAEEALRKAEEEKRQAEEEQRRIAEAEAERKRLEEEQRERERREAEIREAEKKRQEEIAERARKEREEEERKAQAASQANVGGASGTGGKEAESGRASASKGDMRKYGLGIWKRVLKNKPRSTTAGHVTVGFGLTPSGDITYVRVERSSGNEALERRALEAIRQSAPFPAAPEGTSEKDREFTIPFTFNRPRGR